MGMNELGKEIIEINTANGWNVTVPSDWDNKYKIGAVLALIHSEASEALEAVRHDDKESFTEEMADVIIRVLDCVSGLGMDIEQAIHDKLQKNRTRGFRHGGKAL